MCYNILLHLCLHGTYGTIFSNELDVAPKDSPRIIFKVLDRTVGGTDKWAVTGKKLLDLHFLL